MSSDAAAPEVRDAIGKVAKAAKAHGKCMVPFAPNASWAADLKILGVTMFFVASEHAFVPAGANPVADGIAAA